MLGFLWSFFNPLLLMIVYTVVFGFIIQPRDPAFEGSPWLYALFLFCGVLPWTWFSSTLLESANVLMINGNLIKKILFPAEILPVVTVTSNLINFLFGLPILLVFVLLFGKAVHALDPLPAGGHPRPVRLQPRLQPAHLVADRPFPRHQGHPGELPDLLVLRDAHHLFALVRDHLEIELLRTLLNLNPMTHIIEGYQSCLFYGELIHWKKLGVTFLVWLVFFWVGYTVFDRLRDSFPEEV